jgi:predicted lipoprotein with Yx(FWY)xxD motif
MNSGDPSGRAVHRTIVQPNFKRRNAYLAVPVAAVILLAGCGSSGTTKAKSSSTTSAGGGTTTTAASTTAAAPVSATSNPTLGQILVDSQGRTVYVFDNDKNGTIACLTGCAAAWPPVVLDAGASLPTTGALSADLTTVARPDGAQQQVAYKGRPLYRYAGDAKAGDTKGDGVGGIWHAVKLSQGGGATTTTPRVNPY